MAQSGRIGAKKSMVQRQTLGRKQHWAHKKTKMDGKAGAQGHSQGSECHCMCLTKSDAKGQGSHKKTKKMKEHRKGAHKKT